MASSPVTLQSSHSPFVPAPPTVQQPVNGTSVSRQQTSANGENGMERVVYLAAESGTIDELYLPVNWKHQKTPRGNNVLHIHVGKLAVSENTRVTFIRYVLSATAAENSLLLQTNDKGDTPLHFAARFGHIRAVQEFLNQPEVAIYGIINKVNSRKDTALHDAARGGHASIVKLLVEAEAGLLQHMPNELEETPLFLAAERGCSESFGIILGSTGLIALHHRGPCSLTPLHAAVLWGNKDVLDEIMEKDRSGSLIRIKNEEGHTPLHCCAAQFDEKQLTILSDLIKYDDAYNSAAYIQDNEGRTALHMATINFNFKGAKLLMHSYPDCTEMVDNKGQNVVHYAASSGSLSAFKWFLTKMSKSDNLINEKDNDGNTPLHLLAASSPSDLIFSDWRHRLPELIKQHKNLDIKAFNNKNLTAGDIIASNVNFRHQSAHRHPGRDLPRAKRIINSYEIRKAGEKEAVILILRKAAETRLVVAALIVTVSFAAGFTVPGGFDQNSGQNTGKALLKKKAAFIAFLISDTIAFTMSSLATMIYFAIANLKDLPALIKLSRITLVLNYLSLGALMIAFVTGVYAVVSKYLGLAIIFVSLIFFVPYLKVIANICRATWYVCATIVRIVRLYY